MEAVPPVRCSLLGILLLVVKLSVLVSGEWGSLGGSTQPSTATSGLLEPMGLAQPVELGDCPPAWSNLTALRSPIPKPQCPRWGTWPPPDGCLLHRPLGLQVVLWTVAHEVQTEGIGVTQGWGL